MWKDYLRKLRPPFRMDECEVVHVPRFGVSGSGVVIFRECSTGKKYVLKYGTSATSGCSIERQVANRKILVDLLGEHHLPDVLSYNSDTVLMTYLGETLHEVVQRKSVAQDTIFRFHERILGRVGEAWKKSAIPYDPKIALARNPQERAGRVLRAVMGLSVDGVALEDAISFEVVVNGQVLGSLEAILKKLQDCYNPPAKLVRCHGDVTGENVVVSPGSNQWWILDWEWTGWHDWRVSATFMATRWLSLCSSVKDVRARGENGRLELAYELVPDEAARLMVESTNRLVATVGEASGEADWKRQFSLQEAVLLLGDARFLKQRRCMDHLVPLLGEGFSILAAL